MGSVVFLTKVQLSKLPRLTVCKEFLRLGNPTQLQNVLISCSSFAVWQIHCTLHFLLGVLRRRGIIAALLRPDQMYVAVTYATFALIPR
jgi:hypothetical protein